VRLDKFLKVSRLIKRRTVANEACSGSRVSVNGKTAKPAYELKVGDIIELSLGGKISKFEVLSLSEHASKDTAASMYRALSE